MCTGTFAGCGKNTEKSGGGSFTGTGDIYCIIIWRSIYKKKKSDADDRRLFNCGILFNMYYQYSYEKDYLSEFSDQGEALDKLETGTDLAVLKTGDESVYRYDQMGNTQL